jgi:GAF domain-containing protein
MTPAPIPADDYRRVLVLRALDILDTPAEERFDNIARFAAREFGVPIALVSLVDANRQWFKARVGLDICETGRDVSMCSHAILEPNLFIVEDTQQSARFYDYPFVLGPPHIRFYAGAQLRMPSDEVIGTLCLLDTAPRKMDALSCTILGVLRDQVVQEILAAKTGAREMA